MYKSMYTVPGTPNPIWLQEPVYPYIVTRNPITSSVYPHALAIHPENLTMSKNKPGDSLNSEKKEETSKVIQLHLTPYLNDVIRSYMFFSGSMTNRTFFDLSIKHFINQLIGADIKDKLSVFSVYPKFKDGARFSTYATKNILDELENSASEYGVSYQIAYYSCIVSYTKEIMRNNEHNMVKAINDAKEKFPDAEQQII